MAQQPIYQFYAELDEYRPKIWRRFQILNNATMAKLGYSLMTMFEMEAQHLFSFNMVRDASMSRHLPGTPVLTSVGPNEDCFPQLWSFEIILEDYGRYLHKKEQMFDAAQCIIRDVLSKPKEKIKFEYDFGDSWQISVKLEKIIDDEELSLKELPRVLSGEGRGIIEDCGGTYSLFDIAKAFKRKEGEEYEKYSEWLGVDDLDMDAFDIEDINFRLKKLPKIYAEIYEKDLEPTQRSLDIIARKYKS
jgi:hypothetical protein